MILICRKIFERLIYKNLLNLSLKNNLNQVLSKMAQIYISFCLLHIKFINRLTTALKLDITFLFSLKLFSVMRDTNQSGMENEFQTRH